MSITVIVRLGRFRCHGPAGHRVFRGFVRLYASGRYDSPVVKVQPRKGERPLLCGLLARWPAHCGWISIDTASVVVLSAADLRQLYSPDVSGIDDEISSVAWSRDGRQLYAGGDPVIPQVVRRWDAGGRGRYTDIQVSKEHDHATAASERRWHVVRGRDPSFGIIDSQGRARTLQGPGQLDFRRIRCFVYQEMARPLR